jgi:hypothetical protein
MLTLHIDIWWFFLTAFFILGLNYAFDLGPLRFIPKWVANTFLISNYMTVEEPARNKVVSFFMTPLFHCVVCMPSVWGTASYLLFNPNPNVQSWVVVVAALSGFLRLTKAYIQ